VGGEFQMPTLLEGSPELPANSAPRGGPLRRLPPEWSPGVLFAAHEQQASSAPPQWEETPIFDWAGETARRVGNLVHAELQAMDVARLDAGMIRARAAHYRRWLALHGVPADRLDEATARVVQALLGVHGDTRGQWILKSGYRDDVREHALSGYREGRATRVVFDRSFIDDSGIRWVIDYKTSQHLGSGLEQFLDREVDRYRAQLERYALMARRLGPQQVRVGLYFPLMRAWREWSPAEGVD